MLYNRAILEAAGNYLGLEEWPGAKHNPAILEMFKNSGHASVEDDETPWCAAFVGSVLASLSLPNSGKLNARSYESYGQAVRTQDAKPGDIVVLWRGSRSSWQGHVGFFVEYNNNKVILRGGNQTSPGKVSDAEYSMDRIVCIRRADGVVAKGNRPVLRVGQQGAWVLDLQDQLARLNYFAGKKDGHFGSLTLAAVIAFQENSRLTADGIVGDQTWHALERGSKRPMRDVIMEDLEETSRTMATANKGKAIVEYGGLGSVGLVAVSQVQSLVDSAQQAQGLIEMIKGMAPSVVAILAVTLLVVLAGKAFVEIKHIRLKDAQTGANISK